MGDMGFEGSGLRVGGCCEYMKRWRDLQDGIWGSWGFLCGYFHYMWLRRRRDISIQKPPAKHRSNAAPDTMVSLLCSTI